jgi:hypothetical protein
VQLYATSVTAKRSGGGGESGASRGASAHVHVVLDEQRWIPEAPFVKPMQFSFAYKLASRLCVVNLPAAGYL